MSSICSLYAVNTFLCVCAQCAIRKVEDIKPNSVHMALQIPQYFLITTGEVMFSVTGLQFSYSQVFTSHTYCTRVKQMFACVIM